MKSFGLLITLIVCCVFALMPSRLYAQMRVLSAQQLDAIVNTKLENCSTQGAKPNSGRIDPASIIPIRNAREFPPDRVAKTLNGIWQGRVLGDNKDLIVDYFWIVDTKNNEGLAIALRNGKQTVAGPQEVATAPKFTFLLCAHEGYIPSRQTPMIHEFVKVADNIDDAPRILEKATGVKFRKKQPHLSDLWQEIVASKYFSGLPATAFAGALFKPIKIESVANGTGPAGLSLQWDAEYRGGGATSIQYTTGVPMNGVEHAEFVGTSTKSGDYLVSSPGNGKIWKVEASSKEEASSRVVGGHSYDLDFDKVVLGPLK
jgi:hypothetical protein